MKISDIDIVKKSAALEKQAMKAGRFYLNGKRFEDFDIELLRIGESSLSEHIDCQASGQLFFDIMVEQARKKLEAKNLIRRERELSNGRWTYRIFIKRKFLEIDFLINIPCITCENIYRCEGGGEITPNTCVDLTQWLFSVDEQAQNEA